VPRDQKVSPFSFSGDLELIEPDAAAVDVGSRSHWVAVNPQRDPNPVREFGTFTAYLMSLVDWLPYWP
jgi:transposase